MKGLFNLISSQVNFRLSYIHINKIQLDFAFWLGLFWRSWHEINWCIKWICLAEKNNFIKK